MIYFLQNIAFSDITPGQTVQKCTEDHQCHHVSKSCFGGIEQDLVLRRSQGNFLLLYSVVKNLLSQQSILQTKRVLSGLWSREDHNSTAVLTGLGYGTVSCVDSDRLQVLFASCPDNGAVHIWKIQD